MFLSLTCHCHDPGILQEAGILFVAASGNDDKNTDNIPHYPSNYEFGTSMGIHASDEQDDPAWFTNYGYKTVAVGAPGVYILSTVPGNEYANFSGTSMATPLVSGDCRMNRLCLILLA